ncbi:hypothetical protein F4781DRAFT_415463 [Annulohypoxylon bovei var. microspora]|nr:hypothetical protein F4781DRAFT_415463 [Annulohypoxylon bovei var. microspora]
MTKNPETIPRLHHQPVAVDFIDNHLPGFHPAFACSYSKYDPNIDRYVLSSHVSLIKMQSRQSKSQALTLTRAKPSDIRSPPGIMLSMQFWDNVFPVAMSRLEEEFDESNNRHDASYNIRGLKDWDQVYQKLESCFKNYVDDTGLIKKVKRGWRGFADQIGPMQEVWKLVPDIDYLTPIRGTLEFIMDAIRRASETRQQILHGLDNLDNLFRDIELYLAMFPAEINVQEAGISLVLSALVAVEKLIGFYLKPRGKKALAVLFKGDDYEKDVIGSLHDITSKSESLRFEAEKADMLQSTKNWQMAKQRHKELIDLQETFMISQEKLMQNQDSHTENLTKTYQAVKTIEDEVYGLIREYERNKEQSQALDRKISEINDTIQRALTPDPTPGNGWHITLDDIWDMFSSFYFEENDVQHILEKQEKIPTSERAIAESLVTNPRFREWMVSPRSNKVLVQGDLANNRPISSQSVFCSTFLQALRGNPRFISLLYLCGLHSDYDDPCSGPRGMVMSFIAQLILQWNFDTTGTHQEMEFLWDEYRDEPDISDLCALVSRLVIQFPAEITVFCIIDGINAYEKEGYLQDLAHGLACILNLTIDTRVNATIKILIASPCRTLEVREGFHDDAVLVMADRLGLSGEANQRLLQHKMSKAFRSEEG